MLVWLPGYKEDLVGVIAYGRITTRHRGGGADKKYRIIDFKRSRSRCFGKSYNY